MFRADKGGKSTSTRWRLVGGWLLTGGALLFTCAYRQSLLYDRPGFHESPSPETFAPWTTPLPESLSARMKMRDNGLRINRKYSERDWEGIKLHVWITYYEDEACLVTVSNGRYGYYDPIGLISDYDVKYALLGQGYNDNAGCLDKMLLINERKLLYELLQIMRRGTYGSTMSNFARPSKDGETLCRMGLRPPYRHRRARGVILGLNNGQKLVLYAGNLGSVIGGDERPDGRIYNNDELECFVGKVAAAKGNLGQ